MDQQTDILSTLIEQFIEHNISSPDSTAVLDQWKSFPLRSSPQFFRILHQACVVGNFELVKYFHKNFLYLIDYPNVRGETPLFLATKNNHLEIAKFLIENNVDVMMTTSSNDSYLHWLACVPSSDKKNELVDLLLTQYNQIIFTKNILNETPLHIAAFVGDISLVKKLIDCGANPMEKSIRSVDVYEYAVMSGNMELIKYMKGLCRKSEVDFTQSENRKSMQLESSSADAGTEASIEEFDIGSFSFTFDGDTTVDGLFEKFHSQTIEKKKGWKKYVKKVFQVKNDADFKREVFELMKEHFVSKKMIESPNVFAKDKKYRIISIDGGGMKVLLSLMILQRLSAEFPNMFEQCNLYCGCSASSFVVSLLSLGISIDGVIQLMTSLYSYAFKKDGLQIASVTKAKYTNENLRLFVETCFGDLKIKSLPRHVAIPAFLIDSGDKVDELGNKYYKAETFNNIIHENENEKIGDICVRSASAPTFFKPYQNYVDGGVICNNPCSMIWPYIIGDKGLGIPKENVVCLSISAGKPTPKYIDVKKLGDAGVAQWAVNVSDLFSLARRDQSIHESEMLLGDRYCRVDPPIPNKIILDDVDDIDEVIKIGNSYNLEEVRKWMREFWE